MVPSQLFVFILLLSSGHHVYSCRSTSGLTDFLIENIDAENIRTYLRHLTESVHLAGTPAEKANADWLSEQWNLQGLDEVHQVPYDVLLSYPSETEPNMVRLVDTTSGSVLWESTPKQKPLYAPEEGNEDIPFNFNGYSAPGNVTSDVVYVYYGREEDFDYLESRGVSLTGKIVLARYGASFRANVANLAETKGAAGLILYSDPLDYAPLGPQDVYPDTVMLPPSGVALGSVYLQDGDPLTPFYPSIDSAFRLPEDEAALPLIPVQPISYEDAWHIIDALTGEEAPSSWQGGLNITYRISTLRQGYSANLEVHTTNQRATTYNVIGMITGEEEPDRYVVLGNHHDAWIFGAVDPSSGTAAMVELSRVLMSYSEQTGWRPRRTIVFCSWGAEEYGLVGSVEWTEQFAKQLGDRAVAYLNVDMALEGTFTLRTESAPLLYNITFEAAKLIPNPDQSEVAAGRASVYDTWVLRRPDPDDSSRPEMQFIGSGSDYKGFQHNIGIPCLDIRYTHDSDVTGEPLYHTLYETFALVDELYDPGFLYHKAITEMWGQLAISFSDAQILPFSLTEYVHFINSAQQDIEDNFGALIASRGLSFDNFFAAGGSFSSAVSQFEQSLPNVDLSNALAVRQVNDQLLLVERAFIDPRGLPGRPQYNHVVFAPSESNYYAGTAFSGLVDTLTAIEEDPTGPNADALWRQFEEHLAAVTHLIITAGSVLSLKLW